MNMADEPNNPVRLEDLVAHAEGRLPAGSALRARVEEHLHHHPEDAARVDAYRRQDELLRAAYGDIAREPLPSRLQERLQQPERSHPRLALAASLVIGIAVGWLVAQIEYVPRNGDGGGTLAEQTTQSLTGTDEVADADASGIVDTGAVNTGGAGDMLLPEGSPDLSSIGLTATGNVSLGDPAAGLRRYEYRDISGETVQLLVTRDPLIDPASVYTLQNGDFALAYWHQGDNTYLLSGVIEPDRLQALAHETMATLESESSRATGDGGTSGSGVMAGTRNDTGNGENTVVEDAADPMPVIDQM